MLRIRENDFIRIKFFSLDWKGREGKVEYRWAIIGQLENRWKMLLEMFKDSISRGIASYGISNVWQTTVISIFFYFKHEMNRIKVSK